MELKELTPGDEVTWFRKVSGKMNMIPGVVKYKKKMAVAIEVTDPSGTKIIRYVDPERIMRRFTGVRK